MKTQVKKQYFHRGHYSTILSFDSKWEDSIISKNWNELDLLAQKSLSPGNFLFDAVNKICPINRVEHMLSLRTAPDEVGIWHDDGSRELAFSISLNFEKYEGKGLSLREKSNPSSVTSIGFRPFGTLTFFLTGLEGFEHRTEEVISGSRLVLAGWVN